MLRQAAGPPRRAAPVTWRPGKGPARPPGPAAPQGAGTPRAAERTRESRSTVASGAGRQRGLAARHGQSSARGASASGTRLLQLRVVADEAVLPTSAPWAEASSAMWPRLSAGSLTRGCPRSRRCPASVRGGLDVGPDLRHGQGVDGPSARSAVQEDRHGVLLVIPGRGLVVGGALAFPYRQVIAHSGIVGGHLDRNSGIARIQDVRRGYA
jgi:hypothetical protein